jgi:hypothetical protein
MRTANVRLAYGLIVKPHFQNTTVNGVCGRLGCDNTEQATETGPRL